MSEELIQILVVALVVLGSLVQGIAKKKKQEEERAAEAETEPPGWEEEEEFGPFTAREATGDEPEADSAEDLVPANVWEEIMGMRKGTKIEAEPPPSMSRPHPGRLPMPPPRRSVPPPPAITPREVPVVVAYDPHRSHSADLRPRAPVAGVNRSWAISETERGPSIELVGVSREELRRAVVLREVLGRPVSLRD